MAITRITSNQVQHGGESLRDVLDNSVISGKVIDLTDNTLTGTKAEFNAACSDGDFVFTDGATFASLDEIQTWTKSQRGAVTTDNALIFNFTTGTNNFVCNVAFAGQISFLNIADGQTGMILLVNTSGYVITAAASTLITATDLTKISAAGTYLLSYFAYNGNVYVVASGKLA